MIRFLIINEPHEIKLAASPKIALSTCCRGAGRAQSIPEKIKLFLCLFSVSCVIFQKEFFFPLCAKSLQSCPTLFDPMDYNPPGSSVHRILQTRILEWLAIPFSRGSSQPRDWSFVFCASCIGRAESLPLSYLGSLIFFFSSLFLF